MNIYGLSTVPGKSGVAVIRISGKNLEPILSAFKIRKTIKYRYANLVTIYNPNNGEVIDSIICIFFKAPSSFTGEDVIEFHTHGSKAIISNIIESLSSLPDTRLAEPGEFSKRAFLNNKIDLCQAEGLEDLINSETQAQAQQALRQMSGALSDLYNNWRIQLIKILSLIEAFIDFPDEDIPQTITDEIEESINKLKGEIAEHIKDKRGEIIKDGLFITIIGAPNVGKSSLLNFLAKREVAIVSHIAGTTRDIIEVSLDIGGIPMILADTAGLRDSADIIESEGIRRAKQKNNQADFSIAVFDATQLPKLDEETKALINEKTLVLFNKFDQIDNFAEFVLPIENAINISLLNGQGTNLLIDKLQSIASSYINTSSTPIITRARYRENLESCLKCLNNFSFDIDIELAAEEIRMATNFIARITGKIDIDMILDQIFSSFCIGK